MTSRDLYGRGLVFASALLPLGFVALGGCDSRVSIDLFSSRPSAAVSTLPGVVSRPPAETGSAGAGGGPLGPPTRPTATSEAPGGGSGGSTAGAGGEAMGGGGARAGAGGAADASVALDAGAVFDAGVGSTTDAKVGGGFDAGEALVPLHRYAFSGSGTTVFDDVSGADGSVVGGAALDGSGRLLLDGNDDYVDLPNGLVSSLSNATFSAWIEWNGNNCWHRIFSFGNTLEGEDLVGERETELLMTPENCPTPGTPRGVTALFELEASPELNTEVLSSVAFETGLLRHAVLVFDDDAAELRVYVDGALVGSSLTTLQLSNLIDVNNWLGRSQWAQDFNLPGVFDSFEIYETALSAADVARLHDFGPR